MWTSRVGVGARPRRPRRAAAWAGLLALAAALALAPAAPAQDARTAADDLRDNDVTYEEGTLTDRDLADLDRSAGRLADFKVVVLADEVDDYPSADAFAAAVLDELGGEGRVLVYTPTTVGLASDLDSQSELASAKARAIDVANETDSFSAGVEAAAGALGMTQGAGGESGDGGGGGGGGGSGLLLLLVLLVVAVVLFFLWRRSKNGRKKLDATEIGTAEGRVRAEVDAAANLILELSERAEVPDAPPAAKEHFREGARLFSESQALLEEADTRPELEVAFPRVVEARWRLECSEAVLDGAAEPSRPAPEALFPARVPEPAGVPDAVPSPEPTYRGFDTSPWITAAAMAAMTVLANRGMAEPTRHREPMDDSIFGDYFGGAGGGQGWPGTAARRPRIRLGMGRAGRGMGPRR